jgi:hypothetical protein
VTLAQLRTWVQSLGHGTDTAAQQNLMLLRALNELEGERDWKWMEEFNLDAGSLAVGNHAIAVPARTKRVLGVMLRGPGTSTQYYEPLTEISSSKFDEYEHLNRDNGVPQYFMSTGPTNNIYVYPRPDQTYQYSTHLIRGTADSVFAADGDVPPFDDRFHIILGWRCLQWLAFRQRDWEQHDRAEAQYQKILREMEQKDRSAWTEGHVRRSDFYDLVK